MDESDVNKHVTLIYLLPSRGEGGPNRRFGTDEGLIHRLQSNPFRNFQAESSSKIQKLINPSPALRSPSPPEGRGIELVQIGYIGDRFELCQQSEL